MHATLTNRAFTFALRADQSTLHARLHDHQAGVTWTDAPWYFRLALSRVDGCRIYDRPVKLALETPDAEHVVVRSETARLELEHRFHLPPGADYLEEILIVRNLGSETIELDDLEIGFRRTLTDSRMHPLPDVRDDRFIAVPFRHRPNDPPGYDRDYDVEDLLTRYGGEQRGLDPFPQGDFPSPHRPSEGWAWIHGAHALGLFKFIQQAIEFSVLSVHPQAESVDLRFGGTALINGEPSALRKIRPGDTIELGATRYQPLAGGHIEACYAFRRLLDEKGCRYPADFNPPVHWNELYDNPEWFLARPYPAAAPRRTRPQTYTLDLIRQEAQKARDYHCESLYLDPGWDTAFGSFLWGEQWLGPVDEFVRLLRNDYGLGLSLHCPVAPWMSIEQAAVDTWPREAWRMDAEGRILQNSVCMGARQYLDEAERRLKILCQAGATFIMFDGTWWAGSCHHPDHGHPIPLTREDHCEACLDLCRRLKREYPQVHIEMHDMISGGSTIRYTPVYYKYGLPGSYDENWGFELMWNTMADIREDRARALFDYNLGCNVPTYLHIDLRDDNEHCLVFWYFASTNRHLGIGGTHENPRIAQSHRDAMARYRQWEPYFKRGEFMAMQEVGILEPCRPHEIHLHVLPGENALVFNLFNLSDQRRRISGGISVEKLGFDPDRYYVMAKGTGFNPASGWFHVDRVLEPWSTYGGEVYALKQ